MRGPLHFSLLIYNYNLKSLLLWVELLPRGCGLGRGVVVVEESPALTVCSENGMHCLSLTGFHFKKRPSHFSLGPSRGLCMFFRNLQSDSHSSNFTETLSWTNRGHGHQCSNSDVNLEEPLLFICNIQQK